MKNFRDCSRVGVRCPDVQIDTLSYEPLSHKINRFLHGDISSLDNVNNVEDDYDEKEEKFGNSYEEAGYYDIDNLEVDPLNDNLDRLDLAEIRCDNDKAIESMNNANKEIQSKKILNPGISSENEQISEKKPAEKPAENEV